MARNIPRLSRAIFQRAAREFATHRLHRIQSLFERTDKWRTKLENPPQPDTPALASLSSFAKYQESRDKAIAALKDCRESLQNLAQQLTEWYSDDPVLAEYRRLIAPDMVVSTDLSREALLTDNEERNVHRLPPGSTDDAKKADGGVGDKIIWHTILRIGAQTKRDLLFVTQDVTKKDWAHFHVGTRRVLFPRYELVEEYRKHADGATLHVIELSELLKLFDVPDETVEDIRQLEAQAIPYASEENDKEEAFLYSGMLAKQIARRLGRSVRSFEWLRQKGFPLTDNQYRRLIEIHPQMFRATNVVTRDSAGNRVVPGKPGICVRRGYRLRGGD